MNTTARFLILSWILPSALSFFVYYGFASNYTMERVYSESGFRNQYESGIYQYRVLGRVAVLATYDLITRYELPAIGPRALRLIDPAGSDALYTAYFAVNTLFLCLACSALFVAIHRMCSGRYPWLTDLSLLLLMCLMAITQYVVVPYDMMSYFFLTVSMLAVLRDRLSAGWLALLCTALVLGTMTRETSVLIVAFYVAVNHRHLLQRPTGWQFNRPQKVFAVLLVCLTATYVLLRLYYGVEQSAYQQLGIFNFIRVPANLIGTVFFCSLLAVMLLTEAGRSESVWFLLAASPYILAIFIVAIPWETRLFCPLFLCLILLKLRAIAASAVERR